MLWPKDLDPRLRSAKVSPGFSFLAKSWGMRHVSGRGSGSDLAWH